MATKVEVSSVLTSLTNRSELVNEATLQHTFASSLSDTSNKSNEHPSSVSPQISEGRSTFGNPMRPATMPPATSRPRLTPKPFSREKSWDTFAAVKAPVPTAKPGNVARRPLAFAKNVEDNVADVKGMLSGSIPPLVEQKLIENKSTSEFVANMPFYSSPQANTVILFETRSTEETRMKLSSEKTYSTLRAQERQLPSESEMSYRRPEGAAIHQQFSVSSESKPVSCNPHRSLERKESFSGATEERPKNVGKQQSSASLASEEQPRPKQRPVSAIFLESLKDQKQCGTDVSDEKPNHEKSWVRKPRPLSMDLTAKFEIRDFSIQRKSLDSSKSHLKSATQVDDCLGIKSKTTAQIQKPSSNEVGKWEMRLNSQEEENGRETDIAATSGKNTEPPRSKGLSGKERMAPNHKGTCAFSEISANVSDTKNKSLREGTIKKNVNLPDAFESCAPPVNAESFPESPGKENKIMNIQQRIRELTAENTETKPGNLRQSFRSRPLSADLTKLDGHLERDSSFAIEIQNVTLQGESPALVTDHDMKTHSKPSIENVCIKTVRATMFEHHVQRHHIAADHFEAESTLQAMNELVEGQLGFGKESWLEKAREAKMNPKKVSSRQAHISADAGKQRNANISNEDKVPQASEIYTAKDKYEKPTAKHVEDSLMYQRIEPRYEILQTVGKRVQSEAIAVVPEDKAVTLRSRRFLKERRKTDGSAVDASWTCSSDIKGDGWEDDSFLFKARDAEEISTKVTALKEVSASQSQHVSHKQGAELDKNLTGQQHATHKAEVHQHQQLSGEEMVRRSGRHVSGPKASEGWRRKTLPHDAAQFEEVGLLAQESGKALSRRDSLQLHDKLIAKRNPKPRCGAEPQDGSLVTPSSPDNDLKNQLSPSEPKATYFAITYQIPDENANISGKLLDPLRSKHISSLAKDASVTPNTSTSRRSYPPNYQYSERFTDAHVSMDRHLKKNWIEGGEGSASDLPKKGTFKHRLTETRDGNSMAPEKRLEDAKARVIEVDPLHLAGPESLFYFRPLHWDSEHLGQKKCSNHSHSMAKGKASDYYRSKVLDIDALMAQYEGDSKKDSVALGKKEGGLPEDSSSFPWERLAHKRNSPGSTRQDIYATEFCIRERELLRNCGQQLNPSKAIDVNFSPPFQARAVAEKPKYSPAADPVSTRKKTFIVDDDQGEDLVLRHQSAKYANYNSQVSSLVSTDVELEKSFVLHPPQVLSDSALGKDVSLKQLSAVHSEGNWSTSVDVSGADKKQAGAGGSSLENDGSAVKSRAKWSRATSGLVCDLPDLKRSYSEKSRQSRARGSLPSGPETRGRQDQNRVCQSFPPESMDSQLNQQRTSQWDSFLLERTKVHYRTSH
uniref:Uncharacterized protein n=1 Tax=Podarcis muralis TaxID=64176 RepID=A0A670JQT2_PODMU